jgi:hypothetical protein
MNDYWFLNKTTGQIEYAGQFDDWDSCCDHLERVWGESTVGWIFSGSPVVQAKPKLYEHTILIKVTATSECQLITNAVEDDCFVERVNKALMGRCGFVTRHEIVDCHESCLPENNNQEDKDE